MGAPHPQGKWLADFVFAGHAHPANRQHHARHHTDPKNSHYCTITNWLNPVLDGLRFWDGLEWLLARTIRLERREDTSVRGHGPGPAWLAEYRR